MEETSKEAQSRRDLDKEKVRIFENTQNKGQNYGVLYGLASLCTTCVLAYFKAYAAAGIVGGVTLTTIVAIFVKARSNWVSRPEEPPR